MVPNKQIGGREGDLGFGAALPLGVGRCCIYSTWVELGFYKEDDGPE
jgi:hypothetical protein